MYFTNVILRVNKKEMFDNLRCQLRQFDSAWKVGLVVMAVVIFLGLLSRWSTTLDIDQDPIVRKKVVQLLQQIKSTFMQAQQDANPAIALLHVGQAQGYMQAALSLASVDQIMKTTSVNMTDLGLRLQQQSDTLCSRLAPH